MGKTRLPRSAKGGARNDSLLTKERVEHVAGLANLRLTKEEIGVYTKQLGEILGYVEKLQEVDTSKVEPTYQTIDGAVNVWREDEVGESLNQEEAVRGAKRSKDGYFVADSVFAASSTERVARGANHEPRATSHELIDLYNAILTEIPSTEGSDLPFVPTKMDSIKDSPSSKLKESPFRTDEKTIGHKDLFLTKGVETTAGARVLSGYIPQYSGTVVERLKKAGYKAKYKFNCDAWAHGSSGENSDFGATKNPWSEKFTPGGSSSGSAAAVAAGLVEFATGTDTGGSIRLPASFCGVTGLKPTYGAVSRYGIVAMASSLDSPGVIGGSVEEVEKLFGVMRGEDEMDATSRREVSQTSQERSLRNMGNDGIRGIRGNRGIRRTGGIRIGIPKEYLAEGVDWEVKRAVTEAARTLENAGFKIKEVSLPNSKYGIAVYYLVQTTEVASNLGRYDGIRYGQDRSFFGAEAKRRIMLGTFASSAVYSAKFFEKAARVRTLIISDFEKAFKDVDVLIGPVSPAPPFKLGEKTDDPLKMYLSDILTVPVNLAGLPGLAVPCGFVEERGEEGIEGKEGERQYRGKAIQLPIGMQIIGPRWGEELLFEVGKRYQELTEWHRRKPKD